MRQVLHNEIAKERCNAKALGAFGAAVSKAYDSIDSQLQYAIRPAADDADLTSFENRLANSKKIKAFQTKAEKVAIDRYYSKYNKKMKDAGEATI